MKLKSQLDEMRKTKGLQESQTKEGGPTNKRTEETVVLTRTDAAGNVRPLEITKERETTAPVIAKSHTHSQRATIAQIANQGLQKHKLQSTNSTKNFRPP